MMIEYKYPQEKEIALFYAKKLNARSAESILEKGIVEDSCEATDLSKFYWAMAAETINENALGVDHGFGDMEQWREHMSDTFFSYLSQKGYEEEWKAQ